MNEKDTESQSSGINLGDIYYVLFRHKWKIICLSIAGILGAAAVYFHDPPVYQSEAKLLVPYVWENKPVNPATSDSQVRPVDASRGILNSETEILRSLDLALAVVDLIGPEKVLTKVGGGTNRYQAAGMVRRGLQVELPSEGNIIRVVLQHPDQDIVQPLLQQLIESYKKMHVEIHRPTATGEFFAQQADLLRPRLAQTEEELRKLKAKAGVISLEESKKSLVERMSKIQMDLYSTEAELGERKATFKELESLAPSKSAVVATNLGVPAEKWNEYRNLSAQMASFQKREQELLIGNYTEENPVVKGLREQISKMEKRRAELEEENPKLKGLNLPLTGTNAPLVDLAVEASRIKALEARIQVLNTQLESVRTNAAALDEMESSITQLQRKKELEEANLRFFSSSLEQSRIEEGFGAGRFSNITVVQAPSPPGLEVSKKTKKTMGMILALGVLGSLGLAFLWELFLDQSVKRPTELETKLRLPVFLSIPDTARKGNKRQHRVFAKTRMAEAGPAQESTKGPIEATDKPAPLEVACRDADHSLQAFYEALRDRLMTFFEQKNMTHKPKLVSVTACATGAGTTTVATGLAAALSEIGDGNVLLVDMCQQNGAAHPFYKGKPGCGLSDLLEGEKREIAQVQDNLYMVSASEANSKLPRVLPKRFAHLVPKLKASDYDYIIFDMPPVSQTSITPRLSAFMDMVLMVVESEKTNRDVAKRAYGMLLESNANVRAVLNKYRTYVPRQLQQEL